MKLRFYPLLLILFSSLGHAQTFIPKSGIEPSGNPMKGWAPYSEDGVTNRPVSGLAYYYYSWRDIEPAPGVYRFSELERRWEDPSAKGKHVVIRLYLDFPDSPIGVPDWLMSRGIAMHSYSHAEVGSGLSPDYEDPRLLEPLLQLISKLGERYNSNPRVAFIILGTVGFWGEWHTWPQTTLMPSTETQLKIISAYRNAFPSKKILARYPGGATGVQNWIGYHDDFFPIDSLGSENWKFLTSMQRSGRDKNWKMAPIGAEMVPNSAEKQLTHNWALTNEAAKKMHLSWIGPYAPSLESNLSTLAKSRRQELVRALGYKFQVKRLKFELSKSRTARFTLKLRNIGIAPFYYDWPIYVALLNKHNSVIKKFKFPLKLSTLIEGSSISTLSKKLNLPNGYYKLALGIIDPWTKAPAIKLANATYRSNNWHIIGKVKVK